MFNTNQSKSLIIHGLQNLLNKSIQQDPVNLELINELSNYKFKLHFSDLNASTILEFSDTAIRLNQDINIQPQQIQLTLKGKIIHFDKLFSEENTELWQVVSNADTDSSYKEIGEVSIDASNSKEIYQKLAAINIDQEYLLSTYLGKTAASTISKKINKLKDFFLGSSQNLIERNVGEYLLYEAQVLVSKKELEHLEAKITQLEKRAKSH